MASPSAPRTTECANRPPKKRILLDLGEGPRLRDPFIPAPADGIGRRQHADERAVDPVLFRRDAIGWCAFPSFLLTVWRGRRVAYLGRCGRRLVRDRRRSM